MNNYDKFTQALIDASLESWQDDEVGSTTEAPFSWAALFTFSHSPDSIWNDILGVNGYAGAILFCDSQGFYSCERYVHLDMLKKRWSAEVKDLTFCSQCNGDCKEDC